MPNARGQHRVVSHRFARLSASESLLLRHAGVQPGPKTRRICATRTRFVLVEDLRNHMSEVAWPQLCKVSTGCTDTKLAKVRSTHNARGVVVSIRCAKLDGAGRH